MSRVRSRAVGAVLAVATALLPVPAIATTTGSPTALVYPYVQCVSAALDAGGVWEGTFGYVNTGTSPRFVSRGTNNVLAPDPPIRDQPTSFQPGVHPDAFSTFFDPDAGDDAYVSWSVFGVVDVATTASPRCEQELAAPGVAGPLAAGEQVAMAGERVLVAGKGYDTTYQWYRDCDTDDPVHLADGRGYVVQPADVGHRLQGVITYRRTVTTTDGDESLVGLRTATACTAAATAGSAPSVMEPPMVSGHPQVGVELSVTGGTWSGNTPATPTYQWESCGSLACIPVGTDPTYTPVPGDEGKAIRVEVARINSYGLGRVTTGAVGPVRPATLAPGTLLPGAVDFPATAVGGTSTATVHYVNTTPDPVAVDPSVSGAEAASFAVVGDDCGPVVAPGGSCAVTVGFKPVADGTLSAVLAASDGATSTLSGRAFIPKTAPPLPTPPTPAVLALGAPRVDLGKVRVRKQGKVRTVAISNTGGTALVVQGVTVTGRHRKDVVLATTCPGDTVAPGASCTVALRLRPAAAGRRTASLVVTSTAPGGSRSVALVGQGVRRKR